MAFFALRLGKASGLLRIHCETAGLKGLFYYLLMCIYVWVYSEKPKEGAGSLGAGAPDSC